MSFLDDNYIATIPRPREGRKIAKLPHWRFGRGQDRVLGKWPILTVTQRWHRLILWLRPCLDTRITGRRATLSAEDGEDDFAELFPSMGGVNEQRRARTRYVIVISKPVDLSYCHLSTSFCVFLRRAYSLCHVWLFFGSNRRCLFLFGHFGCFLILNRRSIIGFYRLYFLSRPTQLGPNSVNPVHHLSSVSFALSVLHHDAWNNTCIIERHV